MYSGVKFKLGHPGGERIHLNMLNKPGISKFLLNILRSFLVSLLVLITLHKASLSRESASNVMKHSWVNASDTGDSQAYPSLEEIRQRIQGLQSRQGAKDPLDSGWTPDMEEAFWERAEGYFNKFRASMQLATLNDAEKRTYAELMATVIAGNRLDRLRALALLQAEDVQGETDHAHTQGIDYYWCFTLKQQMRKYFLLGELLQPAYRQRMWLGGRIWTEVDPLPRFELINALDSPDAVVRDRASQLLQQLTGETFGTDIAQWRTWWRLWKDRSWQDHEEEERRLNPRPHPLYGRGSGGIGVREQWGPEVRGSWVDGRNTPNLRAMRDTSVYLMAEETGNEMTRLIYKDKLRHLVWQLYQVGMGEWDSSNYLPHTLTPLLNLYDFAQDPEVRLLAKAGLDWLLMSGALKYYHGGFGGPTLRDFGGASHVFGSSASHPLHLYFGDSPLPDPDPRYDDIHTITSLYRPPLAIVELAHKNFHRPVELLNTKPNFDPWKEGNDEAPVFYETLFFGRSFYLGSVVNQGQTAGLPFKLLVENSQRGVDYFLANSSYKFSRGDPSSNKSRENAKQNKESAVGVQMGQNRNLLLWLRPNADNGVFFQIPETVTPEFDEEIWYFPFERTFIAIRPINLAPPIPITPAEPPCGVRCSAYYQEQVLQAKSTKQSAPYVGFALEVGETEEYPSLAAFKQAVESGGILDLSRIEQGVAELTGANGGVLELEYNPGGMPTVVRDSESRDWGREWDVYGASDSETTNPVQLGWKSGTLTVQAGGYRFQQTVTREGIVRFSQWRESQ